MDLFDCYFTSLPISWLRSQFDCVNGSLFSFLILFYPTPTFYPKNLVPSSAAFEFTISEKQILKKEKKRRRENVEDR